MGQQGLGRKKIQVFGGAFPLVFVSFLPVAFSNAPCEITGLTLCFVLTCVSRAVLNRGETTFPV
jgi:hypothetical protein